MGQRSSHTTLRPPVVVASVRADVSTISGTWGGATVNMMMDSGSSVSLVQRRLAQNQSLQGVQVLPVIPDIRLVTASGGNLPVQGYVQAPITVGYTHHFIVVNDLVAPVILGTDFLCQNALVLDFTSQPLTVHHNEPADELTMSGVGDKVCAVGTAESSTIDVVDQGAIPLFPGNEGFEFPSDCASSLAPIIECNKDLFVTVPGVTGEVYHSISTIESPVKIPPRRMPAHFKEEVERQLQDMLDRGIIEESSSPWMAPAVYTKKKSGEIRMC